MTDPRIKIKLNIGVFVAMGLCIAFLFKEDAVLRYIGIAGILYLLSK